MRPKITRSLRYVRYNTPKRLNSPPPPSPSPRQALKARHSATSDYPPFSRSISAPSFSRAPPRLRWPSLRYFDGTSKAPSTPPPASQTRAKRKSDGPFGKLSSNPLAICGSHCCLLYRPSFFFFFLRRGITSCMCHTNFCIISRRP